MSSGEGQAAAGQEVLVVDRSETVLRGMARLLGEAGMSVTTLSDVVKAEDLLIHRFFSVLLVDLDTPTPGAGLELLRLARVHSPLTATIVMTNNQSFDAIAAGFREGASDVVAKSREGIPYIRERVVGAAADVKARVGREELLRQVGEVNEEFLRQMMELSRRVVDLEDKVLQRQGQEPSVAASLAVVNVLIVDDEPGLYAELQRQLSLENGWRVRHAQGGGEALDAASQMSPHVLVVREMLPDLPGILVVKTIKSSVPDAVALLFSPPSEEGGGEVKMMESSRLLTLIPSFSDPAQLVSALDQVREGLRKKTTERRYLQIFRKEQFEFLKRYNWVKQRLPSKIKT